MEAAVCSRWTHVRTLGRGASGAVVSLAADDRSGALFAVKSAAAGAAEQLRHEGRILSELRSPHVLPCLGFRADAGGECQLFLEYAPGGSLADVVARSGGRLEESAIGAHTADVARGLAYLHGMSLVHGDVKGRNVVVGADGRAKIADFGCARTVDSDQLIGGTPAFMAPEVARGEEQGPAADVWALGCTVIEMAIGRAPWGDMEDILSAVHRIGYTDAVPEVPGWLSSEAKDFLTQCFARNPRVRWTASQLLEHPFLSSVSRGEKAEEPAPQCLSPKSTLDAALWESDTDDEEDDMSASPAERIKALACPCSALPDWDSDDDDEGCWVKVIDEPCNARTTIAVTKDDDVDEKEHTLDEAVNGSSGADAECSDPECTVRSTTVASIEKQEVVCLGLITDPLVFPIHNTEITKAFFRPNCLVSDSCFTFSSTSV